jgi:hypothetical protein
MHSYVRFAWLQGAPEGKDKATLATMVEEANQNGSDISELVYCARLRLVAHLC